MITWLKTNKYSVLLPLTILGLSLPLAAHAGWFGLDMDEVLTWGMSWIANLVLGIFAIVLMIAGYIFDLVIYLSVVNLKDFFGAAGIAYGWSVARDTVNIFFIFVLLWTAVQTITGLAQVNIQKTVVHIILIAIVVNFSGVIVRLTVDMTNLLAWQFYKEISSNDPNSAIGQQQNGLGLSWKLFQALRLDKHSGAKEAIDKAKGGGDTSNPANKPPKQLTAVGVIAGLFWGIIMIVTTTFMLLVASYLFLMRTLYLLFFYMIAPLAIGLSIVPVPSMKNVYQDWVMKLTGQAVFAPIYLFLLMIVLKIISDSQVNNIVSSAGSWGTQMYAQTVISSLTFIILIGLMIQALAIAKKFSGDAAGGAEAFGKWGTSRFLGMAGGFVAQGGRKLGLGKAGGIGKWVGDTKAGEFVKSNALKTRSWFGQNQQAGYQLMGKTLGLGISQTMGKMMGFNPKEVMGKASKEMDDKNKKRREDLDKEKERLMKADLEKNGGKFTAYNDAQEKMNKFKNLGRTATMEELAEQSNAQEVAESLEKDPVVIQAKKSIEQMKDAYAAATTGMSQKGFKDLEGKGVRSDLMAATITPAQLQQMMIGGKASSSDMKDLLTRIDRTLNRNGANELATQSLLSKSLREKGAAAETSEKMLKEIARQIAATNKTETPPTGDKPEPKGTS